MLGVHGEVDCADIVRVFGMGQNLLPRLTTIKRAENATLRVGFVDIAKSGYIDAVGICGIDDDLTDLASLDEPDGVPGLARINGLKDTNAVGVLAADVRLSGADVHDIRIGRRHGNGTD